MTYFQGTENKLQRSCYEIKRTERFKARTVFLGCHFKSHVLLFQFLVGLLQVPDVVDGFPQHCRLV